MSLKKTASISTLWSALENGSMTIISFLSLIIFARLLSPADFGVFSVAISVIEVAGILTNMMFHDALIQKKEVTDAHYGSALTASVLVAITVAAILCVFFPLVAPLIGDLRLGSVGQVLAAGLLVSAPSSILTALQRRSFGFRLLALRTLVGRVSGAVLGLIAAFLGFGIWALVIQYMAMTILGTATLLLSTEHTPRPILDLRPIRDLIVYSRASVASLFLNFAIKRVFVFSLGIFLGVDQAGYINIAFRTIDTFLSVSAVAMNQVLFPTLSRVSSDRARMTSAYRSVMSLACIVFFPVFTGLGILAPEVIEVLFGRNWLPAVPYMFTLSLLIFLQVPRTIANTMVNSAAFLSSVIYTNLLLLFYIVVAILFTRFANSDQAVMVWASSEFLGFAAFAYMLKRKLGVSLIEQVRPMVWPVFASVAMIGVAWGFRALLPEGISTVLRIAGLASVCAVIYLILLIVFDRTSVKLVRNFIEIVVGHK